ncbi:phage portal protein [Vibrio parahaemolyticus]|uniref:phage portal protein n=1 Tax=Vibrio parahaemolyticus TaxID=670 RepID=UPI002B255EBB|nr:phage portal protein [Vibrio parahaemolyticus]MEB2468451.1 phage portal protein [Vibrio parahaemolyticus]
MGLFSRLFKGSPKPESKSVNPYIDAQLRNDGSRHAGVNVTYTSAMRQADVYTCVRILSESIGMIPMKLYKQKSGVFEEVSQNTRDYRIFCQNPNGYMTSQELNEHLVTALMLRGHAFLEIVRNSLNGVSELLPMRYLDQVSLSMTNEGLPVARWVDHKGNGQVSYAPFNEEGLLDIKLQSLNGFQGISPIALMAEQIGTAIAAQRHEAKIFENGTRLSGVLSTEDSLDDEAIERLQASWNGAYGGTDNAGKVAVLEHGLTYTNITMTNQDAQLLEMLGFSREQIAAAFRVPVHMLNDTSAQTMNNVEQNNLHFLKNTLMPIITKLENAYNKLLPSNMVVRFDTRQFVRGDIRTQAEVAEILIKNRIISHEESREMFDLAPANEKELFVIQSNNYVWGTREDSQKLAERLMNPPKEQPKQQQEETEGVNTSAEEEQGKDSSV